MKLWKILCLLPFLTHCQTNAASSGANPSATEEGPRAETPENFRVAYVGDIGLSESSHRVMRMIRAEQAGLFVLLGDYDYEHDPKAFEAMLDADLGDVPTLGVIGNHDVKKWDDYKILLEKRLKKIPEAHCEGEIGVKMRCEYKGLVFALSGVGTMGMNHESFLRGALTKAPANFKICAWHKNQTAMQAGNKHNETGWDVYEICREEGAMIATGHEHSYSRTFVLSDFREQIKADPGDGSQAVLDKGQSFAFVSGMGGRSIRGQRRPGWFHRFFNLLSDEKDQIPTDTWWAKVYTADQNAQPSVLFCDYHVDKDPRKARCFLKTIEGQVIETFTIESKI